MRVFVEICMAFLGALGFSMMFNIHGIRVFINGIGGALTWATYLIVEALGGSIFVCCLLATIISMIFSEIMARVSKTPVIILLVPMLVPMVPGGDLYRMMANVVMDVSDMARDYGQRLVMEVGAIAFGIILVSTALQLMIRISDHFKKKNGHTVSVGR